VAQSLAQNSSIASSDAKMMMSYDAQKKSAAVAYILLLLFGYFGAHRFYAGATGSGAAMLVLTICSIILMFVSVGFLTILIPGIWAFVDLFLVPSLIRDYNSRLASQIGT